MRTKELINTLGSKSDNIHHNEKRRRIRENGLKKKKKKKRKYLKLKFVL